MYLQIIDTHKSITITLGITQETYPIFWSLFKRYMTLDETYIFCDLEAPFSKNYLTKIPDTIIDLVLAEDYKIVNSRIWVKMKPPVKNTDVMITLPENSSLDQFSLDIKDLDEVIVIRGNYFTRVYKDDIDPFALRRYRGV
jgi:hypothetical protein